MIPPSLRFPVSFLAPSLMDPHRYIHQGQVYSILVQVSCLPLHPLYPQHPLLSRLCPPPPPPSSTRPACLFPLPCLGPSFFPPSLLHFLLFALSAAAQILHLSLWLCRSPPLLQTQMKSLKKTDIYVFVPLFIFSSCENLQVGFVCLLSLSHLLPL